MKRAEQLQKLSREHHTTLVLTKRVMEAVTDGSDEALSAAIEKVQTYYEDELEVHFQHEEKTVFAPIFKQYKEYVPLAMPLLKEHGALRLLIPELNLDNAKDGLVMFAETLRNHTRVEERELFPIVQEVFSDEQLDAVLNFL